MSVLACAVTSLACAVISLACAVTVINRDLSLEEALFSHGVLEGAVVFPVRVAITSQPKLKTTYFICTQKVEH